MLLGNRYDILVPPRAGGMAQIAAALAFCHEYGILHCDIKPENIMVDQMGPVKLIDFGISLPLDGPDLAA